MGDDFYENVILTGKSNNELWDMYRKENKIWEESLHINYGNNSAHAAAHSKLEIITKEMERRLNKTDEKEKIKEWVERYLLPALEKAINEK
jgi:hypothetical protein